MSKTPEEIRAKVEEWRESQKNFRIFCSRRSGKVLTDAAHNSLREACDIIEQMLPFAEKGLGDCWSFDCDGCPGCKGIPAKDLIEAFE